MMSQLGFASCTARIVNFLHPPTHTEHYHHKPTLSFPTRVHTCGYAACLLTVACLCAFLQNGILKVSACDKVTGAENSVVITNSKGRLSEDEVEKMVAEAEKYTEEDRLFTERLAAKNDLEMMAYNLLNLAREVEIEKLERKAKEVQAWCDEVSLTATTEMYLEKKASMEKLMSKLGVG